MLSPEAIIGLAALLVTLPTTLWCLWKWYGKHTIKRPAQDRRNWVAQADYEETAIGARSTGSASTNQRHNNYQFEPGTIHLEYLVARPDAAVLRLGQEQRCLRRR
ncbi:hypothetical protein QBC39DRAFT_351284 [Podospora conica]|nr:hypothetical protein QBC39DRAFT_351284 [Schizothecium conicum]